MTQYKLVPVEPNAEPVAMRYGFDGYGYHYIDSGSGSDWRTRIDDAEPLYTHPQPAKQPLSQYAIDRIVGSLQVQWPDYFDLEAATKLTRAIEAAHGITGAQK